MKIILVLCVLAGGLFAQSPALQLLDSVKSIYGSPCEIGVPSPLIDSLRGHTSEYAVKDYLQQFDKLNAALSKCNVSKGWSAWNVDLSNLYGREQNFANAVYVYWQNNGALTYDLTFRFVANYSKGVKFYGSSYAMPEKDFNLLAILEHHDKQPFYRAVFFSR